MKHVVTAARPRQTVLVTGFGAFPNAPVNPTEAILRRLERHRSRLRLLGIHLILVPLPVAYARLEALLAEAILQHRPDAILHLGLASRRSQLSVETRAINRAGPLHHDADGRLPASQILAGRRPPSLAATYPAARILAALRRERVRAALSRDAGDYVCNATLYRSLDAALAPIIGFVHVPRVRRATQPVARTRAPKPTIDDLTRAALAAVLVLGRATPEPAPACRANRRTWTATRPPTASSGPHSDLDASTAASDELRKSLSPPAMRRISAAPAPPVQ